MAQSGFPKYYAFYALWHKGDSCYSARNFSKAADYFYKAANAEIEKGLDIARDDIFYQTASAYTLAGYEKNAIQVLWKLAFELHFKDSEMLQVDSTFLNLHHKKEWNDIVDKVLDNQKIYDRQEKIFSERTLFDNRSNEILFYQHRSDFTRKILNQDTLPFLSISHGNFRIYFSGNSYAASHLIEIKGQVSIAFTRAIEVLQVNSYNRGISLILFNSVDEMKNLTGVRALGGMAYAEFDAGLFPITVSRRPQFKHEIFHVMSLNTWGNSASRLLIEGSAVFADNECYYENPISTINAYYRQTKQLCPVDSLINHFDEIAVKNDVLAYLQSAGVFKYLYEKYGVEKMKQLWARGFKNFNAVYGFSIEQFETEWLNFLKTVPVPEDFDINKLKEGCG